MGPLKLLNRNTSKFSPTQQIFGRTKVISEPLIRAVKFHTFGVAGLSSTDLSFFIRPDPSVDILLGTPSDTERLSSASS